MPLLLVLLSSVAHAHGSAHHRSLGGLHDAAVAQAHRAALVASLAGAPQLRHHSAGSCNLTHAAGGYWEACGGAAGNLGSFSGLTPAAASAACCGNPSCAGLSFSADGSGYYKRNVDCGFVPNSGYQGYAKPGALPPVPNVTVLVTPPSPLLADVVNVTVSFAFLSGAPNRTTDWVGQVCAGSPIADYIEFAPVDFFTGWATGAGSFSFTVFHTRCDYQFVYFRGSQPLWPTGQAVGVSAPVAWATSWRDGIPFHTHIAYGGEDTQHSMVVSFTTNTWPGGGGVTVMVGTAPGVYDLPNATDIESTTYGASDLCNAPANTSSIDFWQWPGVFHHATLRGLAPATRYYVRPVADGLVGEEATWVTGAELGPDVPVVFALFGDMSVTQYVLDGDTKHDVANGGPGAVGTAQRLRARVDEGTPLDFVLHFGDLGYATGAVFLWDAWMSMMSAIGSRAPYMVSIGNHEVRLFHLISRSHHRRHSPLPTCTHSPRPPRTRSPHPTTPLTSRSTTTSTLPRMTPLVCRAGCS